MRNLIRPKKRDHAIQALEAMGYKTTTPMIEKHYRPKNAPRSRWRVEKKPAIASLLFVISNRPMTSNHVWQINTHPWEFLIHFYGVDGCPQRIHPAEIKEMEAYSEEIAATAREIAAGARPAVPPGASVQITDGALEGFEGVVEGGLNDVLNLAVHMMGRVVPVEVPVDAVEVLDQVG